VERAVRAYGDQRYGAGAWTLEVTDVRADPESARADGVYLSPTLRRMSPEPQLRWFGDLSDGEALTRALSDADA
jgi:hypothetical protein